VKEQKNIDRLFQEKFKNFEAEPGDQVWANIAAQQQKKRTVIIPLWLRLSGAAAVLVLLFIAGNLWFANDLNQKTSPAVVIEEPKSSDKTNTNSLENDASNTQAITSQERSENSKEAGQDLNPTANTTSDDSVNTSKNNSTVLVNQDSSATLKNTSNSSASSTILSQSGNTTNKVVANSTSDRSNEKNNPTSQNTSVEQNKEEAVAATSKEDQGKTETAIDPDALEKIANQTKEEAIAETDETPETINRWGISPMVAPVYYNSFGGSGIDAEFTNNKKSGDINLSYGVQVSYAVNKRLTLRSGINKVDLGYKTEQVSFSPSIQASSISSINYNDNAGLIQVSSTNKNSFASVAEFDNTTVSSSNALLQQLGYIEVPIEAEYALINKKIGVQVIGGVSTLFLNDNSISLDEGNNVFSQLGESNSLNSTSFSTNVGLGFDYKFTDRIQFNIEPMFKYQLNAYTKSVSDFKPYYLGIYTGVSIKF